jgi:hypothetical protein
LEWSRAATFWANVAACTSMFTAPAKWPAANSADVRASMVVVPVSFAAAANSSGDRLLPEEGAVAALRPEVVLRAPSAHPPTRKAAARSAAAAPVRISDRRS